MKTVHLMGIGGMGMTSLAGLFQESGWKVRGSDVRVYPPASIELSALRIPVAEGYSPENLKPRPDLVVVGNVISRSNPEAEALLSSGIPYLSMPAALMKYFAGRTRNIVAAGTHGKTTTASLLSWILDHAGMEPGFFIGGVPANFGRGYRWGGGNVFVLEGDEYDTAFFEKTPKFLHYGAKDAILTSVEFDHADIYKDLSQVIGQFVHFVSMLPADGLLLACGDSETVRRVCDRRSRGETELYGFAPANSWRVTRFEPTGEGASFFIERGREVFAQILSPLPGRHNALNALSCVAMAARHGVDASKAVEAVAAFTGVRRRQQFLAEARGVRVYDDFAHHPTAIAETIAAFEPLAKRRGGRLWVAFEPRSNTCRRRVFEKALVESFKGADEVVLGPVYAKADGLSGEDLLSPSEVAGGACRLGISARAVSTADEVVEIIAAGVREKDVVVFMSNGDFCGAPERLCKRLSEG